MLAQPRAVYADPHPLQTVSNCELTLFDSFGLSAISNFKSQIAQPPQFVEPTSYKLLQPIRAPAWNNSHREDGHRLFAGRLVRNRLN
jgi:hypothetical protein